MHYIKFLRINPVEGLGNVKVEYTYGLHRSYFEAYAQIYARTSYIHLTKVCSASYVSWKRGTTRIAPCCCAPCSCGAGRAADDRHLLSAGPTAANSPHVLQRVYGTDRQTDRRTIALSNKQKFSSLSKVSSYAYCSAFAADYFWLRHCINCLLAYFLTYSKCGNSVDNTVEENSSVFSIFRMHWLPSARACGQ